MTEKLEKCRCGNQAVRVHLGSKVRVFCTRPYCQAGTAYFGSPEEAAAAWNRMQSQETFTREDMLAAIKLTPWRSGYDPEDILTEIMTQRRKP